MAVEISRFQLAATFDIVQAVGYGGGLQRALDPDVVITSDRDSNGFLLWETASVAGTADYRNDYQFDGYGRPVGVTQDAVAGGNSVEKKRVEFSYDLKSRLAAIDRYLYETDGTTLDPVASSSYSCTDGELTGLVHSDPADTVLAQYGWRYENGRIVGEDTDANGLDDATFTYDTDGQLDTVIGTGRYEDYNYDSTGNRTTVTNSAGYASYTVDAFNRVTCDGTYHYDYDPEGNRVAKYIWTDAYPWDGEVDWNADEISNWTVYTWDHRNRLIRVESGATYGTTDVTVTFGYDWLNRWISTDVDYASADDTSEYLVYGGATLPDEVAPWDRAAVDARDIGQITLRLEGNRDFTDGKETADIANRYLWGPAVDQILADEQVSADGQGDYTTDRVFWPLADHQGTVRDLAELRDDGTTKVVQRRTYDAYGNVIGVKEWNETAQALVNVTAPAVDHLFGFTARPNQTDAGLINCLNRWYDPEIASWTTQDPISFQGGDANLYRYCGNDPVNGVDPSGLDEAGYGPHWFNDDYWDGWNPVAYVWAGGYYTGEWAGSFYGGLRYGVEDAEITNEIKGKYLEDFAEADGGDIEAYRNLHRLPQNCEIAIRRMAEGYVEVILVIPGRVREVRVYKDSQFRGNRPAKRTIDASGILGRVSILKPGRDSDDDGERQDDGKRQGEAAIGAECREGAEVASAHCPAAAEWADGDGVLRSAGRK